MNVAIEGIIVIGIFALVWGWIIYEMYMAPEYDENEMPIKKNNIDIDITEDDIVGDLDCIYKGDERENEEVL